jgi:hypothetical protein
MNVDFAAIGGTAYTVAGSMIIACEDFISVTSQHFDMLKSSQAMIIDPATV